MSYPKTKGLQTEVNRDILREMLLPLGLEAVSIVAIDEVWSALRFKRVGVSYCGWLVFARSVSRAEIAGSFGRVTTASLGDPLRSQLKRRGKEPASIALGRDARTEFRLIRDPNRNAWTLRSELNNR